MHSLTKVIRIANGNMDSELVRNIRMEMDIFVSAWGDGCRYEIFEASTFPHLRITLVSWSANIVFKNIKFLERLFESHGAVLRSGLD